MNGRKGFIVVLACVVCLGGIFAVAPRAHAGVEVNVGFFYDRLAPYGTWYQHPQYGWVWYPRGVPVGWRPYTMGHWVYAEDGGWAWVSSWEWGWAPFHYGRWFWDDDHGWVWVPGMEWAPAWVAWRTGGGFIGWAPLPPEVGWSVGVGFVTGGFHWDDIGWHRWVFVQDRYFLGPIRDHIVIAPQNVNILRETRNVTNFVNVNGRVVNRSISRESVERMTGERVERVRLRDVDTVGAMRLNHAQSREFNVFRPQVRSAPSEVVPPRPEEADRNRAMERQELRERYEAERNNIDARYRQLPRHMQREEWQRRQEAERNALENEHARQERFLEHRGGPQRRQE